MKLNRKLWQAMGAAGLVVGLVTIVMGFNEATVDALDRIGSNYWLAYVAIAQVLYVMHLFSKEISWLASAAGKLNLSNLGI